MAVPSFTPNPDIPAYFYDQVAEYLAATIIAQKLPPGARLPNERDLAAECGVSIATGRRAVRVLRDRGLVVTKPAKGHFVVPHPHDTQPLGDDADTTARQDLTDYDEQEAHASTRNAAPGPRGQSEPFPS